jgi:hypothetical protein
MLLVCYRVTHVGYVLRTTPTAFCVCDHTVTHTGLTARDTDTGAENAGELGSERDRTRATTPVAQRGKR